MTPELIDLEFAHMEYDNYLQNANKGQFEDDTFDEFDKETDEMDSRLSDIPDIMNAKGSEGSRFHEARSEVHNEPYNPDDWEEVDEY